MASSLQSRTGTLLLITAVHLVGLRLIWDTRSPDAATPPVPLPMVMLEMMPTPQPKVEPARPLPQSKPQPKQETKPQPHKAAPPTTTSEKAITTPKPVAPSAQPAPAVTPEPAITAPPAPLAPPAPVPLTPPQFSAAYLNNPAPAYPPLMRRAGEEGNVLLKVFVTAEGSAGEVRIVNPSSSPLFDEAAVKAVRQWRFVPARRGDTPIAEWVNVPIVFKLN